MRLKNNPNLHLTYCTNIHPGESWPEVFDQLRNHVPELKARISPEAAFGLGLRLSAEAARQLREGNNLEMFKQWLDEEDVYVFTMNGFPYGSFHGQRVKEQVYAPDWRSEERVEYTMDLLHTLKELLPEGMEGGISTSPLSYKAWLAQDDRRDEAYRIGCRNLIRIAKEMARIYEESGKILHLDIEPEPDCLLENTQETVDFFTTWLFKEGTKLLAGRKDVFQAEAKEIIRRHIRVCYDTCHFAVEYEDPETALRKFREAGIRIGKTQISSALRVHLGESREHIKSRLEVFREETYLHQVIERRIDGSLHHFTDLSDALSGLFNRDAVEWRIHFHVPIFLDAFENLCSTQDDIVQSLRQLREDGDCSHFEIETYTWQVLPEELKTNITDSIEREYQWVLGVMDEGA